ncbi:MAG: hypothetical protein KZQ66_11275 [Candidatus Thiodiazotropha sp. (ex Lucinoma aequizonata)]|nr:hypothetical protein [Candidatus Thiodiazotropha sp. (ex Lucinoma aequizonata)]MCU7889113.1 hypothetical protein [Candidatus Thiodiazotropha sp. (ex Lucinoma aequizonata)]MCU7894976.1 hypothetical protein [Candidatus Thiodiazotropha sp. (ex Lucinoma aequizonata)]MCU7898948.1 hypothetical protein [Candidatus Thiodiazotropha sp. (ex Lucinoma aequizonata)]MCU7902503.1 hypothetical protein [Candidatus Thiodiazotropha sp. (ex Lucinoma aequizonata)]
MRDFIKIFLLTILISTSAHGAPSGISTFKNLREAIKDNVKSASEECLYLAMLPKMAAYAKANPDRFNPDFTPYIAACNSSIYKQLIDTHFVEVFRGASRNWRAGGGKPIFTDLALADKTCQTTIFASESMQRVAYRDELSFLGRPYPKWWDGLIFYKVNDYEPLSKQIKEDLKHKRLAVQKKCIDQIMRLYKDNALAWTAAGASHWKMDYYH